MDFDKEQFLKNISTIPSWVTNGDDLLKFCKHIQYRLLQAQAVNLWYREQFALNATQSAEVLEIRKRYDESYDEDKSNFKPFQEIFNQPKE